MLFRLCLALGYWPHPDYLEPLLSTRQQDEWRAFELIEPFGEQWNDIQFAKLRATIAASVGVNLDPAELMYDADAALEEAEEVSDEALKRKLLAAFGITP